MYLAIWVDADGWQREHECNSIQEGRSFLAGCNKPIGVRLNFPGSAFIQ